MLFLLYLHKWNFNGVNGTLLTLNDNPFIIYIYELIETAPKGKA